ncbi:MAG: carbohydrate binding family 9 domain-containing protein, partial [Candidatus Hodarchaeota archaeon]
MMRVVAYRGIWLLAVVFSIAVSALGGEKHEGSRLGQGTPEDPYIVPEAATAIAVDGVLNEEAWESALILDLPYETWPGENTPAPVRTECLLTFDKALLYIGFRAFDPDPSAIRAHYAERGNVFGEDYVQIGLDTFNDGRRAYILICNALGVQVDFLMTQSSWGVEWDAIFYSAGKVNERGYAVEMAIPFNQLQFHRTSGPQIWGFEPMRFCPRLNWSHIQHRRHDRSDNNRFQSYVKIKGFEGIDPGRD